jgi:hypothetical protein
MSDLTNIPTDYKKYFDQTLHRYLEKINTARSLFTQMEADSAENYLEYVRQTQVYQTTTGYLSFSDPELLADGASTTMDSIGTENSYSTPITYSKGFRILRKLLTSKNPIPKELIAQHTVQMVNSIENYINRALYTNMASNASQTYSAPKPWASGGDAIADFNLMKANFKLRSGGQDMDFIAMSPLQSVNIRNDFRMQNILNVSGKLIDTGDVDAMKHPVGVTLIEDSAVPINTAIAGKKGMFGNFIITENYKTFVKDEDEIGMRHSAVFSGVDQYVLPYMLMSVTGI